jgi:hypothetical protein
LDDAFSEEFFKPPNDLEDLVRDLANISKSLGIVYS